MPKSISWRKLVGRLRKFGFDGPYPGGRHLYMVRGEFKLRIPNPHRRESSRSLVAKILRQAGIASEEWEKA